MDAALGLWGEKESFGVGISKLIQAVQQKNENSHITPRLVIESLISVTQFDWVVLVTFDCSVWLIWIWKVLLAAKVPPESALELTIRLCPRSAFHYCKSYHNPISLLII